MTFDLMLPFHVIKHFVSFPSSAVVLDVLDKPGLGFVPCLIRSVDLYHVVFFKRLAADAVCQIRHLPRNV